MVDEVTEKAKPVVKFVQTAGKLRDTIVTLDWPVEIDGTVWSEITIRRVSSGELEAYLNSPDGTPPPNICAPKEVLDNLDAEDGFKIEEASRSFFPRRSVAQTEEQ